MPDNPFHAMVAGYAGLLRDGAALMPASPAGEPPSLPASAAPMALIFAPHPDDECVIGGLPLRLRRELGMQVGVVAVTQGSRRERRAARWRELAAACAELGFAPLPTVAGGLERIVPETRTAEPDVWTAAVRVIADILDRHRPAVLFVPHAHDWHPTHVGTHHLVLDALAQLPAHFTCRVVETEFWGAMADPDLLVESSVDDVALLVLALSRHAGEVARNPYHLRLPAWLIDNVRRGAELVQGRGEAAPAFTFATLYRLRRWAGGRLEPVLAGRRLVGVGDDLRFLVA